MIDQFNHITLNTAHSLISRRTDVSDAALLVCQQWLNEATASDEAIPLPAPDLAHFSCQVSDLGEGDFIATVFAPASPHVAGKPHHGDVLPLVTFCLVTNDKQAIRVWHSLKSAFGHLMPKDLRLSTAPWLAVAVHPSTPAMTGNYQDTMSWLADFERCIAWAWIKQNNQ